MARVHNFSAGPAALPTSVLAEIADEMMDYRGCGMSVLEMSHRSSMYQQIIDDAEATLRRLLSIPDNYRVLFLQGGATLQFAGIPMNLMRRGRAGYVVTGNFANKAFKEAAKYDEAVLLASSEDTNFDRIPDMADINARIAAEAAGDGLDYVYICQNNTIFGTMYHELPDCGDVPLVADVSSCFLSQPLDVERYGLIYAGAQKNAGAAGVTVVIVRDDLIADGPAFAQTPQYLDLKTQAAKGSMLNTPNTFGIYVCGKVFHWVEQTGGLGQSQPALRPARAQRAVPRHCADRQSLHRQRHLPHRRRRARCGLCCRRRRAPDSKRQGPSPGGRHARQRLQRRNHGRRAGTSLVYEGLRSTA